MIAFAWLIGPTYNLARFIPTTRITAEGRCIQNQVWPNMFWDSFVAILSCFVYFFFPLILISILYLSMFCLLRNRAQSDKLSENTKTQSTMNQAKVNVLKTFVLLTVLFVLCWVWNITYFFLVNIKVLHTFYNQFYTFSVFMSNLTCCVNPFCYALQYKDFQDQVKVLCGKSSTTQVNYSRESVSSVQTSI